ncbi:negative transcriptional regulator [Auricularia subglabra TFB-10046 SS5]|nr:negative transcriptional regulator [Auricularia subglabra TFB-10046 SS5]
MYLRAVHAEHDLPTLRAFVRANPLGLLTTAIDAPGVPLLQSSHIPFLIDDPAEGDTEGFGKLRGHIARANPQAKAMIAELRENGDGRNGVLERDVLVVFTSQAHAYVTPKFYTETKPATGKVVPTWDYAAVQVYGRAKVFFNTAEAETDEYLQAAVDDLSRFSETQIAKHEKPWEVADSPRNYIELLKKAIIGIEIEITDMGGKWKMSQESTHGDLEGVIKGFAALGTDVGKEISETVRQRAPPAKSSNI